MMSGVFRNRFIFKAVLATSIVLAFKFHPRPQSTKIQFHAIFGDKKSKISAGIKQTVLNVASSHPNEGTPRWQPFLSRRAWQYVAQATQEEKVKEQLSKWELSKLPPAQQAHSLGVGLMRLSATFGWCLTDDELCELRQYQSQLEETTVYMSEAEQLRVKVAVEVAFQAHNGQRRRSGERFVIHPVAVGIVLAQLKMDCDTVVAGLLHDTVEDTCLSFEDIQQQFGDTVRKIVEGETKVSKLSGKVADYNDSVIAQNPEKKLNTPAYDKQASNLRHMLIAMSEDWRVLVVKLADRLHNMQTISAMPEHKQKRIARETMDVFVPLAHRLGLWEIKCELEELCFPILDPEGYAKAQQLVRHRAVYTRHTPEVLESERARFECALKEHPLLDGLNAPKGLRVSVGTKTLYSIHKALQRNAQGFFDVLDIVRFSVIFEGCSPKTDSTSSMNCENGDMKNVDPGELAWNEYAAAQNDKAMCYRVMEAVHAVLQPTSPPRVKDYIAFPKNNGYTSLQSNVFLHGYPIEVQIRTKWMDRVASTGVAAGWLGRENKGFNMQLPWLREVQRCADESCEAEPSNEMGRPYSAHIRAELEDSALGRRFVFTNEGALLDLNSDATVGDAASQVITQTCEKTGIKQRVVAVKVNSRLVGLNHKLSDGDIITIITTNISDANHDAQETNSEPAVLGNVRTQLVRSGVWPWCLVGAEEGDLSTSSSILDASAPVEILPKSQKQNKKLSSNSLSGDELWYKETELKHGRISIIALVAWLNSEMVSWVGGRGAGAPTAATLAHQGALAHLYSLTPLQVVQIIMAVGVLEWCHAATQQKGGPEGGQIIESDRLFFAPSNSTSIGVFEENSMIGPRKKETNAGRLAMIAVSALLLQSYFTGDDALGHVMGLF